MTVPKTSLAWAKARIFLFHSPPPFYPLSALQTSPHHTERAVDRHSHLARRYATLLGPACRFQICLILVVTFPHIFLSVSFHCGERGTCGLCTGIRAAAHNMPADATIGHRAAFCGMLLLTALVSILPPLSHTQTCLRFWKSFSESRRRRFAAPRARLTTIARTRCCHGA